MTARSRPISRISSKALDESQPRSWDSACLSTVRPTPWSWPPWPRARYDGADGRRGPHGKARELSDRHARGAAPRSMWWWSAKAKRRSWSWCPPCSSREGAPPLNGIRGLAYRNEAGEAVRTPARPLRKNIDEIPFPARDLLDLEAHRRAWRARHGFYSLSIIASRGCPYECAWCQKGVFGRSYRPRIPESVAEEMRQIKAHYHPDQLRIVDDVMGIDRRWVKRWRDAVVGKDAAIPFECLSRVDLVDRDVLGWLKEAGCIRIAFGAESGSQKVLDAMTKGTQGGGDLPSSRAVPRTGHRGLPVYHRGVSRRGMARYPGHGAHVAAHPARPVQLHHRLPVAGHQVLRAGARAAGREARLGVHRREPPALSRAIQHALLPVGAAMAAPRVAAGPPASGA